MSAYLRRLLAAVNAGALDRDEIWFAEVRHDRWCAAYKEQPCNCDAEIVVSTRGGRVEVLLDGTVKPLDPAQ